MSSWLYVNIILFIIVVSTLDYPFLALPDHIAFGLIGLFFILFNWTRHAFFSTIRNSVSREKKIRLANISKKVYPFHRWVGSSALVLLLIHAGLIIHRYGFQLTSFKMWSGMLAIVLLSIMVLTGWLRLYFPSGRKRRAHIITGFLLFFLVAIHTVLF